MTRSAASEATSGQRGGSRVERPFLPSWALRQSGKREGQELTSLRTCSERDVKTTQILPLRIQLFVRCVERICRFQGRIGSLKRPQSPWLMSFEMFITLERIFGEFTSPDESSRVSVSRFFVFLINSSGLRFSICVCRQRKCHQNLSQKSRKFRPL